MTAKTRTRVEKSTPIATNVAIYRRARGRLSQYAATGNRKDAQRRMAQLDHEWDIERVLEANASTLALAGLALGALVDRRWLVLPMAVLGFLLEHAVQGWCPPLRPLRSMGFRTVREIEQERQALQSMIARRRIAPPV